MAQRFEASDWQTYKMDFQHPHREIEPVEREIAIVDKALDALISAGILPHKEYDHERFRAHRAAVRDLFEIPWTAITPRLQRVLYAINAITQPRVMVATGIFCGNTYISNAGAAIGPGACYTASRLVGIEIKPDEAARARRNVARVDPTGVGEIVAMDGVAWLRDCTEEIDLLYLDANGAGKGKSIYLDMVQAALHSLRPGSIVLAHNSQNDSGTLADYLAFMRDPKQFRESVNVVVDDQGLEVSIR
ncbi:hypothetical protein GX586_13980 [bacterium]|nr:hypothetical protein [bacterium]